jgi:hypothetical protein
MCEEKSRLITEPVIRGIVAACLKRCHIVMNTIRVIFDLTYVHPIRIQVTSYTHDV